MLYPISTQDFLSAYTRKSQLGELRTHPKLVIGDVINTQTSAYVVTHIFPPITHNSIRKHNVIRLENIYNPDDVYYTIDHEMFLISYGVIFGHSRAIYGVYFWVDSY